MDHASHVPQTSDRRVGIPPVVWFLGLGLIAALLAIFAFNVPLGTVGSYALFAFFIGGHFFMHGSHGGHAGHADRRNPGRSTGSPEEPAGAAQSDKDEHAGHSGGCH